MSAVPENVLRHELIGLKVTVVQTRNRSIRGTSGVVIDESKNMLTISKKGRKVLIPKSMLPSESNWPMGPLWMSMEHDWLVDPEARLKTRLDDGNV